MCFAESSQDALRELEVELPDLAAAEADVSQSAPGPHSAE